MCRARTQLTKSWATIAVLPTSLCTAWGEVADFAQNLERGDTVLCAGYLVKDEYRSHKENADIYQLTCDFISVMH